MKKQTLPADIDEGDLLVLNRVGACSEGLFTHFNGMKPPQALFLQDLKNPGSPLPS